MNRLLTVACLGALIAGTSPATAQTPPRRQLRQSLRRARRALCRQPAIPTRLVTLRQRSCPTERMLQRTSMETL